MPSGTIIMPSGTIIMPSGTIWPEFLPKLASVAPGAPAAAPAAGSGTQALPGKLGVRTKNGELLDPTGEDLAPRARLPARLRGARSPPLSGPEALPVFGPHAKAPPPDNEYITRYRAFMSVD